MSLRATLPFVAGLVFSITAMAHDYRLGDVRVSHPFATPAPPSVPHGAAYVDISVEGGESATLVGARTPASDSVELHDKVMEGGVMQMRRVERITVPGGNLQTMRPGSGYHLMLMHLATPLNEGERFPLTLEFAERGELEVEVWVQGAREGRRDADDHHR